MEYGKAASMCMEFASVCGVPLAAGSMRNEWGLVTFNTGDNAMTSIARLATIAAPFIFAFALPNHATIITYEASLSGPAEAPPNASPATGFASVDYDSIAHTLSISASWADLIGPTTVAHIHCCTALPNEGAIGVAVTPGTLPGFPAGVTSGTYDILIDLTNPASYTGDFVTNFGGGTVAGAEAALIDGLDNQLAYFNIHTSSFPGGEIRGFLAAVPEPATLALVGLGLAGLGWNRRQRQRM
jgi:hypothetical protein